jgi:hypothetical protein
MPFDLPLRCRCGHVRGLARGVSPSSGFRFVCYCEDCQAFAHLLAHGPEKWTPVFREGHAPMQTSDGLDAAGGTDIFQMPPGLLRITDGADALRCLAFSSKVLRWYAACCKTPIANGAASPRFPLVALIHSFIDLEAVARSRDKHDFGSGRTDEAGPLVPAEAGTQMTYPDLSATPLESRLRGNERERHRRNRILLDVLGPPLCRIYERSAVGLLPDDAPPPPSLAVFLLRARKLLGWWLRGLGRPNPFFDDRTGAPVSMPRAVRPHERAAL